MIRRWGSPTGEPIGTAVLAAAENPLATYAGDLGAQVFRACVACHALNPDEGSRAGPTLHGIFGRRIATLPGYNFSAALKQLNIPWRPETVEMLFEVGGQATFAEPHSNARNAAISGLATGVAQFPGSPPKSQTIW